MSIEPKIEQPNENTPANTTGVATTSGSVAESTSPESEKEINWKRFREAREVDRKKREEAERESARKAQENEALRAALESVVNKPVYQGSNSEQTEESEEQKIGRLVDARMADRDRKDAEVRAMKEEQELPQRLSSNFKDFNEICSEENIDYLQFHYPEIHAAFDKLPRNYDTWSDVYKTIKKLIPNPHSGKDQRKAEKNFTKPQSMAAPGVTSTTDSVPVMLDDKRREANWQRMQKVMKGGR